MTPDEIRQVLVSNADVTMPRFNAGMEPRDRVEVLEDYLNLTAVARAELDRARLHASGALRTLSDEWSELEGWQITLPKRYTQADVTEAKRQIRPDLYMAISDAKWLVARLSEQIHRLELDDKAASRLYTIITGT